MTDKIDVTLPLSAETVELFEHAFGVNWRSRVGHLLIPTPADQNPLAQSRRPMDMIVQGRSMSLFQASQQWSTRSV